MHFVRSGKIDKKFAKYLKNLKDDREDGDYGILTTIDKEDAKLAIEEAAEFINEIKRILNI